MYSGYVMLSAVRCFTFSRSSFGVDINKALNKNYFILSGDFTFLTQFAFIELLCGY